MDTVCLRSRRWRRPGGPESGTTPGRCVRTRVSQTGVAAAATVPRASSRGAGRRAVRPECRPIAPSQGADSTGKGPDRDAGVTSCAANSGTPLAEYIVIKSLPAGANLGVGDPCAARHAERNSASLERDTPPHLRPSGVPTRESPAWHDLNKSWLPGGGRALSTGANNAHS